MYDINLFVHFFRSNVTTINVLDESHIWVSIIDTLTKVTYLNIRWFLFHLY